MPCWVNSREKFANVSRVTSQPFTYAKVERHNGFRRQRVLSREKAKRSNNFLAVGTGLYL